jgi:2-polyprenyl-3-methyl-5-hydroxy-6-metoxy-1,4-benzoquinol methylase
MMLGAPFKAVFWALSGVFVETKLTDLVHSKVPPQASLERGTRVFTWATRRTLPYPLRKSGLQPTLLGSRRSHGFGIPSPFRDGATRLDLGCGKLRYTIPLSRPGKRVVAVDSEVQLSRIQIIAGQRCSIRKYAALNLPNVEIYSTQQTQWRRAQYDYILCSNVLSAIPCYRVRKQLLTEVRGLLKPNGVLLVTTQHRNSYFKLWLRDPRAESYLDGFLVSLRHGASFYGLIPPKTLKRLSARCGLRVIEAGSIGETAYVLAGRRQ